jgi:quinol-cytochrome oxidoreductase complex cytochrome b subunit
LAFWAVTIGSSIAGSPRDLTDALSITQYFDPGGFIREVLLGANYVGEEALIHFFTPHVMVLPIALATILGAHLWRIRKDGGLARPSPAEGDGSEGAEPEEAPTKSFGLMAVVRERICTAIKANTSACCSRGRILSVSDWRLSVLTSVRNSFI